MIVPIGVHLPDQHQLDRLNDRVSGMPSLALEQSSYDAVPPAAMLEQRRTMDHRADRIVE